MNDLIKRLRNSGLGCHWLSLFMACIMYADDLCLLAPTRSAMQKLISICVEYCNEFCLSFNATKSKTLLFGKTDPDLVTPLNYGKKKKRTVTSFACKSFENSPRVLKFLLELLFGIIKHHWKNRWPALNSLGIIDFLKVLVRWSEIQLTHIRIFKEWINKI